MLLRSAKQILLANPGPSSSSNDQELTLKVTGTEIDGCSLYILTMLRDMKLLRDFKGVKYPDTFSS